MTDYFSLQMSKDGLLEVSSLGLAYLGDAVYELMVRSYLCLHGKARAKDLHRCAVRYVSAPAQARLARTLLPQLTEEEKAVFRRGRNTAPHSIPKAARRSEYQAATALEALFGWLYLRGEQQRLNELFQLLMVQAEAERGTGEPEKGDG